MVSVVIGLICGTHTMMMDGCFDECKSIDFIVFVTSHYLMDANLGFVGT